MSWRIEEGDCIERLAELADESVDAIVTDPPYGIGFMGHAWDQPGDFGAIKANGNPSPFAAGRGYPAAYVAGGLQHAMERQQRRASHHSGSGFDRRASDNGAHEVGRYDFSPVANRRFQAWCQAWCQAALRVLKPGGHMVAFGSPRTYHRLASGAEDAGFEIRDTLVWLFGGGFPKNRKLTEDGQWGTALKPGMEPILLARKPCRGPAQKNFNALGTGGLHVDACRIPLVDQEEYERDHSGDRGHGGLRDDADTDFSMGGGHAAGARWPANVLIDPEAGELLDEQSGVLLSGANPTRRGADKFRDVYGDFPGQEECEAARGVDVGGASRFFYCAKTSRAERNAGLDGFEPRSLSWSSGEESPGTFQTDGTARRSANHHPTVKPISLMRWLTRLVTPEGGLIVDLFTGSGTTGVAAVLEGFDFIGFERNVDGDGKPLGYIEIAEARIRWWESQPSGLDAAAALAGDSERRKIAETGQGALL